MREIGRERGRGSRRPGGFRGTDHTSFRLQKGQLRRLLAWPPALALNTVSAQLAKPKPLRQFRSLRRVVRRDHRIVSRQLPLRAVFVRRHSERRQVPPQRFEFKAVVQTHEIIRCDRLTNRYRCRCWFRRVWRNRPAYDPHQRRMHGVDQGWQVSRWQRIVGDEGRDDVARKAIGSEDSDMDDGMQ
jgi:hypothetical protein